MKCWLLVAMLSAGCGYEAYSGAGDPCDEDCAPPPDADDRLTIEGELCHETALSGLLAWQVSSTGFGEPDSDADGLSDDAERGAGTDPFDADTDHDGYGDLLEQLLPAALGPCADATDLDGDRLSSCEEEALGTDPGSFDSDLDRIADGMELFRGTDPLLDDAALDPDADSTPNGEELALGSDPLRSDLPAQTVRGYRYRVDDPVPGAADQTCATFAVAGIRLFQTGGPAPGSNTVLIHAFDVLDELSGVRPVQVACVLASFYEGARNPVDGRVTLLPGDFHDPAALDLAADCVRP